ncbi:hypothetical protein Athai_31270 [Actinocatenispora thailandica]|uniref:Immunity protein 35 domain-containing protein n=1 Tax=Actinocatenispora thailandica TaxID=227318 RepID=A0A7R7DPX2_9ACTN|nr:YrhB domain-containing protein [Actinocatenispora thailandica]BCJ35624.1 hypothetical protein Athai_31270 [Actinocatenispora thailandica]
MDAEQARACAQARLDQLQDPAAPLRLSEAPPTGYRWCWAFTYNTVAWYETGVFRDAVVVGPLVVDQDGEVWQAPSAPPLERWLNEHARQRGFPEIPTPPPASLW